MNTINQADIADDLQAIVELAQKATVECPGVGLSPSGAGVEHSAGECPCNPSRWPDYRIQDPKLQPLLDVLRVKCDHAYVEETGNAFTEDKCPLCKGTGGYVLRSWDGLPEGALAGALEWSFPGILSAGTADYDSKWAYFRTTHPTNKFEYVSSDRLPPDQAALQAVRRWLEEYVGVKA